jgi:preprotein translocase subunit SecA
MSKTVRLPWRDIEKASARYAERPDRHESKVDRRLLAAAAGLQRPFSRALTRAAHIAERVEREQQRADALSDSELRHAADDLRVRLSRCGFEAAPVARAFSLVRAAARRTLGVSHFPVQVMGGHVILQGMLAEMATGEGKTLTATLPAATAALAGMPVHVITINDYLTERDGNWMRPVYEKLGLSVGITRPGQHPHERRAAYAAEITYCTNKDVGFDYLRDTLAMAPNSSGRSLPLDGMLGRAESTDRLLLRGLHFAIIDEADSVLIDEARTPLIIAGTQAFPADQDLYANALAIAAQLERDLDFRIDARERVVRLTDRGRIRLEQRSASLPGPWRSALAREELGQRALTALFLFDRDIHYLVLDRKVKIVDEYTGRVLMNRSWEQGLQQLIEAKEGCEITSGRTTLARITYQRLFRRYLMLGGMTGTGIEVAAELEAVYALKAVRIPTNRPVCRSASGVRLYAHRALKWDAVAQTTAAVSQSRRPVLIGTRSVAASEELSRTLTGRGIDHVVLNARQDSKEADVVGKAGEPGRVTVATNMAGRGTDIRLAADVAERGGLHVILTEYHESQRVDRQLFGRCARQGEPGSCEAVVSLEDELFVRHAAALVKAFTVRYGERTGPLPAWCGKVLRSVSQRAAEAANSYARRVTLESDGKRNRSMAFAGRPE